MKKLLSVLFAGILLCSALVSDPALVGSAVGSTVLGVSNRTPNVGESITITITIRADEPMYATEGELSFDSSILQFERGASASLVDGNVKLIGTPGGASSQTFSLTFKALAAGQSTVSLGNAKYVGSNSTDVAGSSFRLTVNAPSVSDPDDSTTSGTTGDCAWTLDGTVLTISDNGKMGNYPYDNQPWGKSITKVIIKTGVTSIGNSAFSSCSGITSVTIPNSVTSIGQYAFQNCSGLTSVTIPDSVISMDSYAFSGCENITDVTISQNLVNGFKNIFKNYDKIKSVTLDENTVYISELAFSGCSELESVALKEGVTSIGRYAFYGCKKLKGITISESVTDIGNYAFYRCSELKSITIPKTVTGIEDYAFKDTSTELKIFTTENSAAHKFAVEKGINYYLTELTSPVLPPVIEDIRNIDNESVEIRLRQIDGYEYRCDDGEWQKSNIFKFSDFNSHHNFYQRVAETENHGYSETISLENVYIKNKNTIVPKAPKVASKTYSTISLKPTAGCEYSIDGVNWQVSPVFNGLLPATRYLLYQREAETESFFASMSSPALIAVTAEKTGDVNGDGVVDIRDLVCLKKYFAAPAKNSIPNDVLDVSGDGIINSADLAELRKILLAA